MHGLKAWEIILKDNAHFQDWDERLENFFPEEYSFLSEILKNCAHKSKISIQEAFNIALSYNFDLKYKALIDDILIKDGYLHQEKLTFRFNSPLLQDWWKNRHPQVKKPSKKK